MTIPPYGGKLVDLRLDGQAAQEARQRAESLPRVQISNVTLSDLYLLGVGGFSPLDGFMGRADYDSVLDDIRLVNGLPWSVPVTLSATPEEAQRFGGGDDIARVTEDGAVAAIVTVSEVFDWDREREAQAVYGTTDRAHPGVARLDDMGDRLVGGRVQYLYDGDISGFPERNLTPAQTRAEFEKRGWETVVAFQTRNPVHRAHEYLQKCALEVVDVVEKLELAVTRYGVREAVST